MNDNSPDKLKHNAYNESEPPTFKQRLLMLHDIGNDLSMVDSFDELCRQAVVKGRQLLNCRRISLWFRQGDTMLMTGSFGIDEQGQIRDERARVMSLGRNSLMGRVLNNKERVLINKHSSLYNDMGAMIGRGELVAAALWNGSRVVGCICTDNLLDKKPFVDEDFDILDMFASTVGHLSFRKRAEDELKKLLREKELLLMEINHRVKNNLQVISSLLSLQSAYVRDPRDLEMFRQSQNRVKSIAMVYDAFSKAHDLTNVNIRDYMTGIVRELVHARATHPIRVGVQWEGGDESLELAQAIPCSLIVTELVTNALKHGFNSGEFKSGKIEGGIRIAMRGTDDKMAVTVENNGNPFPADVDVNNPNSLGLTIINILVAQLKGHLVLEPNAENGGVRFTFTFVKTSDMVRGRLS